MKKTIEANFDGIVGPTHNYAGLAMGNLASLANKKDTSYPREAALQGLFKMKSLADMGLIQGVLAPQPRPDIGTLKRLGFYGKNDAEVIAKAAQQSPFLLANCSSASSMWTANAATVSPSADTQDGRTHFTPANLQNRFHRSNEYPTTARLLKATFSDTRYFAHHQALPSHEAFGDEGAANHTRLSTSYGETGLEIFTYGGIGEGKGPQTQKYPARQTREASQAIARLHGLSPNHTFFVQQNPDVIDQGVFHNDVIAVGNLNCLLYHEHAYLDEQSLVNKIHSFFSDSPHYLIRVPNHKVSVTHAIQSYLFNSQLISLRPEQMILVVPEECRQIENVWDYLNELSSSPDNPIIEIKVFDVKQSMKNGGGPACLRLRVVLNEDELKAVNPHTLLNDTLYSQLVKWVNKHYRESLEVEDLGDPLLHQECQTALDELSQILRLGSVYDFQGS